MYVYKALHRWKGSWSLDFLEVSALHSSHLAGFETIRVLKDQGESYPLKVEMEDHSFPIWVTRHLRNKLSLKTIYLFIYLVNTYLLSYSVSST